MIALVFGLLFPLLLIFVYWSRRGRGREPAENEAPVSDAGASTSRSTGRRMRRRAVAASSQAASSSNAEQEDEAEDDEGEDVSYYTSKTSKKREQKRQERDARRQAESAAREYRREKQDKHAEMRKRRDEEREAEEQRQEEELQRKKEEEEAAAAMEFENWKGSFTVETEGRSGENTEEGQNLINDFVEYIKKHKCMALEDLAAEFRLRTRDCINRIMSLEQTGRISGVMDDRGKFIYISPEEMKAVADYIKREGRVSISHLAKKSNEFIDLEPKEDNSLRFEDAFQDGTSQPIAVA